MSNQKEKPSDMNLINNEQNIYLFQIFTYISFVVRNDYLIWGKSRMIFV